MTYKVGDVVRVAEGEQLEEWRLYKNHDYTVAEVYLKSDKEYMKVSLPNGRVSESFHSFRFVPALTAEQLTVPYGAKPAGRKDDSGKLDMTLFDDMPLALKAVAEVMQWAITKKEPKPYERGSWLGVEPDRYRAAQQRHNVAQGEQASNPGASAARFQKDAETGLLHEAHKACSALFALELILREQRNNESGNVPE